MQSSLGRLSARSGRYEHIAHQAHHTSFGQAFGQLNPHLPQFWFPQKSGQAPYEHLRFEARQGFENAAELAHRLQVEQGFVGITEAVAP
jgi:hypothetical protein